MEAAKPGLQALLAADVENTEDLYLDAANALLEMAYPDQVPAWPALVMPSLMFQVTESNDYTLKVALRSSSFQIYTLVALKAFK